MTAPSQTAMTGGYGLVVQLAQSSVLAFPIHVAGVGAAYLVQIAIARLLGAHDYGIYAYVYACVTVAAYLATFGFDVALLRFLPAYEEQKAWSHMRGLLRYAQRRVVVIGLCGVLVFAAALLGGPFETGSTLKTTLLVGVACVPVWSLLLVRSAILRGFGGTIAALLPDRLMRDTLLLGMIGAVCLFPIRHPSPALVMLGTLASLLLALAWTTWVAARRMPGDLREHPPVEVTELWRRSALSLLVGVAAEALMNRSGIIILGAMGHTADAGIFSLASNFGLLITLPKLATNAPLVTVVSRLHARGDSVGLQLVASKTTLWGLLGGAVIGLALWFLAAPLLRIFGPEFATGVPALKILIAGQVLAASAGSQIYFLTMTGHEIDAAIVRILSTVVGSVLALLLIPRFGLFGAATASTVTLVYWNAAMALLIWRRLGLLPGLFAGLQLMRASTPASSSDGRPCNTPCNTPCDDLNGLRPLGVRHDGIGRERST